MAYQVDDSSLIETIQNNLEVNPDSKTAKKQKFVASQDSLKSAVSLNDTKSLMNSSLSSKAPQLPLPTIKKKTTSTNLDLDAIEDKFDDLIPEMLNILRELQANSTLSLKIAQRDSEIGKESFDLYQAESQSSLQTQLERLQDQHANIEKYSSSFFKFIKSLQSFGRVSGPIGMILMVASGPIGEWISALGTTMKIVGLATMGMQTITSSTNIVVSIRNADFQKEQATSLTTLGQLEGDSNLLRQTSAQRSRFTNKSLDDSKEQNKGLSSANDLIREYISIKKSAAFAFRG